jgi:hypothetical protein
MFTPVGESWARLEPSALRCADREDAFEERRASATDDDQAAAQECRGSESAHDHRSVAEDISCGDQTEDHGDSDGLFPLPVRTGSPLLHSSGNK